jgi:short-subunit dehydrogenase
VVTIPSEAEHVVASTIRIAGRLDLLVNNAGRGHLGLVEETSDEVLHSIFAVNVFALWNFTRPSVAQMKRQGFGRIITVASMAGKIGYPLNGAYVAAKHAAVGFTHALRAELIDTEIHASVVCPGSIKTDFASMTEGGPLISLFSASGPAVKRFAWESRTGLPAIEGVLSPDRVAEALVESLDSHDAEIYIHRGSHEFVRLSAEKPAEAEEKLRPIALGELEAYRALSRRGHPSG